jgi:hypothetical protein
MSKHLYCDNAQYNPITCLPNKRKGRDLIFKIF